MTTPIEVLEEFSEKAAILELDAADAFPTRKEAEDAAWAMVKKKHGPALHARAFAESLRKGGDRQ